MSLLTKLFVIMKEIAQTKNCFFTLSTVTNSDVIVCLAVRSIYIYVSLKKYLFITRVKTILSIILYKMVDHLFIFMFP